MTKLKQQPGQDITVGASGTLVRFLLAERLLDELRLLVHPVVAGTGKRLFERRQRPGAAHPFRIPAHRNGVVALRYASAS